MALRYWVGGTGNWDQSTTTHWASSSGGATGASVPTASDDVIFDANSGTGTVTVTANAPCNSVATSASSLHGVQFNTNVTLTVGSATAGNGNIALDFSGFTTSNFNAGAAINLISTSATVQTVKGTGGGSNMPATTINGAGSSYQLGNTYNCASTVTLTQGALDCNGQTCSWFGFVSTGSSTRSLTLGAATITLTSNSTISPWQVTSAGLTISAASGTLIFNNLGSATQTITLNTFTYGTVKMSGSATNLCTFASTVTIGSLQMTGPLQVAFNSGNTKTVTGFWARGTAGNLITITSTTSGTPFTINKTGGTVLCDYISLKDCTASGTATFFAGANSTNVSGNTNWSFTSPAGITQTASMSPTGAYGPTTTKPVKTASLPSSGAYGPTSITHGLDAAGLTFSGLFLKVFGRALTAVLSITGLWNVIRIQTFSAVLRITNEILLPSQTLYPSSNLYPNSQELFSKITNRSLQASLTANGSFAKAIYAILTATLVVTGLLVRTMIRALAAGLSVAGAFAKVTKRTYLASMTLASTAYRKAVSLPFVGALTSNGTIGRAITRVFTASYTAAATFVKTSIPHAFNASITPTVTNFAKRSIVPLTALVNMVATQTRVVSKSQFTASLVVNGATRLLRLKVFSAVLSSTGSAIGRQAQKALNANIVMTGSPLGRFISKVMSALLQFSTSIQKTLNHNPAAHPVSLSATLSMGGALNPQDENTGFVIDVTHADTIIFPDNTSTVTLYSDGTALAILPDLQFILIDNNPPPPLTSDLLESMRTK